jgi:ribosome recycling factor
MTIQDWLGLTLTALSILTIVGIAVRWAIRHYLKDILYELKPNSGSSIKDQVTRLEAKQLEIEKTSKESIKKIDRMYEILLDYISKTSK